MYKSLYYLLCLKIIYTVTGEEKKYVSVYRELVKFKQYCGCVRAFLFFIYFFKFIEFVFVHGNTSWFAFHVLMIYVCVCMFDKRVT